MGCFNTLYFKCPSCGQKIEEQSKSGSCSLSTRPLAKGELADIREVALGGLTQTCPHCKGSYHIKVEAKVTVEVLKGTGELCTACDSLPCLCVDQNGEDF